MWLILLGLYVTWFVSGKPNIRVDYLAMLSQRAQPQASSQDNAWPHYERAMELFVPEPNELVEHEAFRFYVSPGARDLLGFSDDGRRLLEDWLAKNRSAWDEFVGGASKPYCWRQYTYRAYESTKGDTLGPSLHHVDFPMLPFVRRLALLGIWQSRVDLRQDRRAEAIEDCLVAMRAACHWQRLPLLIEQLVGQGISSMGHAEILRILDRQDLSPADLEILQQGLARLYRQGYPLADLEENWLRGLDSVQRLFTEDGPGGGHVAWSRPPEGPCAMLSYGALIVELIQSRPILLGPGRDETIAKGREIFELQRQLASLSPYERHVRGASAVEQTFVSPSQDHRDMADILFAVVGTEIIDGAFRSKAIHEATRTIVALLRWREQRGVYPASLDELVAAGFLDALPADPYNSGTLSYKVVDGDFVLYSLGPDFDDDGGSPKGSADRLPEWPDDGDVVFWPVSED